MERLGRFGQQADRHVQVAQGLLVLVLRAQQVGAADIGRAVVRIGLDRAGEIGQRLVVAVRLAQGERPVGIGRRVIGIDLHRLGEIRRWRLL